MSDKKNTDSEKTTVAQEAKEQTIKELRDFELKKSAAEISLRDKLSSFSDNLPEEERTMLSELLSIERNVIIEKEDDSPDVSVFLKPQQAHSGDEVSVFLKPQQVHSIQDIAVFLKPQQSHSGTQVTVKLQKQESPEVYLKPQQTHSFTAEEEVFLKPQQVHSASSEEDVYLKPQQAHIFNKNEEDKE